MVFLSECFLIDTDWQSVFITLRAPPICCFSVSPESLSWTCTPDPVGCPEAPFLYPRPVSVHCRQPVSAGAALCESPDSGVGGSDIWPGGTQQILITCTYSRGNNVSFSCLFSHSNLHLPSPPQIPSRIDSFVSFGSPSSTPRGYLWGHAVRPVLHGASPSLSRCSASLPVKDRRTVGLEFWILLLEGEGGSPWHEYTLILN